MNLHCILQVVVVKAWKIRVGWEAIPRCAQGRAWLDGVSVLAFKKFRNLIPGHVGNGEARVPTAGEAESVLVQRLQQRERLRLPSLCGVPQVSSLCVSSLSRCTGGFLCQVQGDPD